MKERTGGIQAGAMTDVSCCSRRDGYGELASRPFSFVSLLDEQHLREQVDRKG
jgi:hypothetical protein